MRYCNADRAFGLRSFLPATPQPALESGSPRCLADPSRVPASTWLQEQCLRQACQFALQFKVGSRVETKRTGQVVSIVSAKEQGIGELVSQEAINSIVRAIAERFSPYKIILFGSYASGSATPDSDLDLLVVMDTDLPPHKRATPMRLLFRPVPCAMDILVYAPEEVARWNGTVNHIITEVMRRGKTLYERA